jgi:hypothetical protein
MADLFRVAAWVNRPGQCRDLRLPLRRRTWAFLALPPKRRSIAPRQATASQRAWLDRGGLASPRLSASGPGTATAAPVRSCIVVSWTCTASTPANPSACIAPSSPGQTCPSVWFWRLDQIPPDSAARRWSPPRAARAPLRHRSPVFPCHRPRRVSMR